MVQKTKRMRGVLSALLSLVLIAGLLPVMPTSALAVDRDSSKEQVHVVIDNTVYPKSEGAAWDGVLVDTWVDINKDSTMMSAIVAALDEKGYTQKGADSGYISEINGLAAGKPDYMSGWMGTLNDWVVSEGFQNFKVSNNTLAANDEIHVFFSKDGGADHGGTWDNNDTSVKAVEFSAGTLDKTFDKDTYSYTLLVPKGTTSITVTPTATNKNFQVRTYIDNTQYKRTESIPVINDTTVKVICGDPEWPSMNKSAGATAYTFTVKSWTGEGTETSPYLLESASDLTLLSKSVAAGESYSSEYFKITSDLTLPSDWTPIGTTTTRFKGSIDGGNHLLTVPVDGLPLLGATETAAVSNLNIYGEKIAGYGLVNTYTTGSSKACITIKNVTLKSGSSTLKSGFIGGYASGSHAITIEGCTIESGVTIGYDGTQSNIGAFAGEFNGTIKNCVSHARVKGVNFVGGIVADKGQSMGTFVVDNCTFDGVVQASGNYAGGIVGAGYGGTTWGMSSAPNSCVPTITNCTMTGSVAGTSRVGGILGGEGAVYQCWENGAGSISNNVVTGSVSGETEVGAVIGFVAGLDKYITIENNRYTFGSAEKGIGRVEWVDTSYANPTAVEGTTYLNSGDKEKPLPDFKAGTGKWDPNCFTKYDCNRTDDPLGVDAAKLCSLTPDIYVDVTSDEPIQIGDTVTVDLSVVRSQGIAALQGTLDYDKTVFELVDVSKGAGLSEGASFMYNKDDASFSFYNNTADTSKGIVVATVTFKALKAYDNATIGVKDAMAAFTGSTLDQKIDIVHAAAMNVLAKATLGDVNNNSKINIVDAQIVYDMATDVYGKDYSTLKLPEGWTQPTLLWVANVNADDVIDSADALAIQYYALCGSWGTEQ